MNFSQRDPRWSNQPLGFTSAGIGKVGCLLTATASLLTDWGKDTDPARLNATLRANGGFVSGGLLAFGAIAPLGAQVVTYVNCELAPAPVARMKEALTAGQGVLAAVDWSPGGALQTHWVRLLSLGERDGQIMDPWQLPGKELVPLATYLASDWDAARGIFDVVIYRQADARGGSPLMTPPAGGVVAHQRQLYQRRRIRRSSKQAK